MKTNTKVEYWGDFWVDGSPERKVPGHLQFHPRRHGTLRLHGSLTEGSPWRRGTHYPRIRGDVLGRACILLECFPIGGSQAEANPGQWDVSEEIFVNEMLLVPKADAAAPAEQFRAAYFQARGLAEFDGRDPFRHDFGDPDAGDEWDQRLVSRRLEHRVVDTAEATIRIAHGIGSRGPMLVSQTLVSHHSLIIEPHAPASLEGMLDLVGRVRNLLALAMHQDCRMRGPIQLSPVGSVQDDQGRPYDFHAVWPRGPKQDRPGLYNRVLSFDALGEAGIRAWLDTDEECGHVIDRLASLRFSRQVAYEDALLRVVSAADSLHRVVSGQTFGRLETILRGLAEFVGSAFTGFVPDLESWAEVVASERHNAAHNKGLPVSRPALGSQLVSSVYWLTMLGLLRRMRASEDAIESVIRSQPFAWPMQTILNEFQ